MADRWRVPSGKDDVARRQDRVLRLKAAGFTNDQIADRERVEEGWPQRRTAAAVAMDISRAARRQAILGTGDVNDEVAVELVGLAALERTLQTILRTATGGRCGTCGRNGDEKLALQAADRIMSLHAARRDLRALDAPKRKEEHAPDKDSPAERIRQAVGVKLTSIPGGRR